MKQLLVIAIALASANAFATRARVTSLGNSAHLIDTQTVYSNPADMMSMGDYVNFESGTTAVPSNLVQNQNAEGVVTRSMENSKFGFAIGNQSRNASVWGLRGAAAAVPGLTGIVSQQNPVTFVYGTKINDTNFAGSLAYSNYNDKAVGNKESSAGIRLGARGANYDARVGIGLVNTFESNTAKFKGTTGFSLGGGYWMDETSYLYGSADVAGFKAENTAGAELRKVDVMNATLGALNSFKKDGNELFYGIGLASSSTKIKTAVESDK